MDQHVLLTSARNEFLRSFSEAVQKLVPLCVEDFFVRADDTYSSVEQGKLLDARAVLVEQGSQITLQLTHIMDGLLTRSLQTTYNNYRPAANFSTENLSLIDSAAFEGGLRLEGITSRFRNEAGEELRDLNIRIAVLFQQEFTNERENPFRPFLFSRCFTTVFENLELNANLVDILVEHFAENFLVSVPSIYLSVNADLAKHGVAAQLPLKIKKNPSQQNPDGEKDEVQGASVTRTNKSSGSSNADAMTPENNFQAGAQRSASPTSSPTSSSKRNIQSPFEQYFSSALNRAANLVGLGQKNLGSASKDDAFTENLAKLLGTSTAAQQDSSMRNKNFSWLKSGEAASDAIRQFFGSSAKQSGEFELSHGLDGQARDQQLRSGEGEFQHVSDPSMGSGASDAGSGLRANYAQVSATSSGPGGSIEHSLPRSVYGLQRNATPNATEMFDGYGGLRNLILERRVELNELTKDTTEQMTIDIVAMLFEFILRDTQVPAEIRAQLGRLQFLVLKLALRDNSLLTQKGHPARMLVNRIGSISLGLKQIDPSGIQITQEICRIVETLLQDDSENPQLFSRMLDEFDAFIARELQASDKKVEVAIQGVESARKRSLQFAHTTLQLREALQGLIIDPYLNNFFQTVWLYVLELADREDSQRAHRYRLLVPDLLWSIIPKSIEAERVQLLSLLPVILGTLKEGLATIAWEGEQKDALMNWLVDAHTKAMRINHSAAMQKAPSLVGIHQHFNSLFSEPDLDNYAPLDKDAHSGVNKFLDDAMQALDDKVQLLDRVYVQALPDETHTDVNPHSGIAWDDAPSADDVVDPVLAQLRIGVSVEINFGGEPSQGTLNWIDPTLANVILSLEGQEQPSMVSVRMFRRMIAHGRVKFLETEPLFERAVQSLLRSADAIDAAKA